MKSTSCKNCVASKNVPFSIIDTHTHITFPQFDGDRDAVLERAWDAGLEYLIAIGSGAGLEGNEKAVRFAEKHDRVFAAVGIHPHDAGKFEKGWLTKIVELAKHEKVVAVGEIGLDYHYMHAPKEEQQKRFRELLVAARQADKPVVIHDREAHEDVWRIIEEVGVPAHNVVFHCFSGDVKFARRASKAGYAISIPGVVTFKNAAELHEVVAATPLESMVIETDCPYLSPEPHRGKRNEPAYVAEVARRIADIKGVSFEDVARMTTLNAKRLFNLPGSELQPSIAYRIRNSVYLNITNRCNLACRFCPKFIDFEVKGHYLKLHNEPDVEQIFQAVGQPEQYDEVVFCGYGEPTKRIEVVRIIAERMKERGAKRVRLNTDGLANLVYGKNVLPDLEGLIDSVSVSLNAADAKFYAETCPSRFGEDAYPAVCEFIAEAKKYIPEVVASIVALPGLDIEACHKKAAELGVPLRVREYMNVG